MAVLSLAGYGSLVRDARRGLQRPFFHGTRDGPRPEPGAVAVTGVGQSSVAVPPAFSIFALADAENACALT